MRKWLLWFPVLMVASALYWTLALSLGGLSLLALSTSGGFRSASEPRCHCPHESRIAPPMMTDESMNGPIVIHLQADDSDVVDVTALTDVDTDDDADEADDDAVLGPPNVRGSGGAEALKLELRDGTNGPTAF